MNERIFGYDWTEIQALQQKQYRRPRVDVSRPSKAPPSDADRALLAQHGSLEALEQAGLFGVADRLRQ